MWSGNAAELLLKWPERLAFILSSNSAPPAEEAPVL
jgi:hypothetical protein